MAPGAFVKRPQLADDIARHVRRRIFDGTLGAGTFIRLEQVALDLGTSSTPVREAMLTLRGEGLVELQPRRGFVVLPVTEQDVRDVSNVQAYIGGQLAERAAVNIDAAGLDGLRAIEQGFESACARGNFEDAVLLNHDFHRAVNIAAASPKLAQFMSGVARYVPEGVFPTIEGWIAHAITDHGVIIVALEQGDGVKARAAMSEHFISGVDQLISQLRALGVLAPG